MSTDDINGSTFTPEPVSSGSPIEIGDDLSSDAKETLASYLSALTTNSYDGNTFKIEPDNPVSEISLRQDNGLPSEFTTGGSDETEGFTKSLESPSSPRGTAPAVSEFDTLSDGMYNYNAEGVELVDKNSQTDGHFLLTNVKSTAEANEPGVGNTSGKVAFPNPTGATAMQRRVSAVLQQSNKFDPMPLSSPYITSAGAFSSPGIPIEQGQLGVYDPDANRTQIAALTKVAYSQLMRATGHKMGAQDPVNPAGTVSTTGVQKGRKKVNVTKLRPKDAAFAPERFDLPNVDLMFNDEDGAPLLPRKSFGNLSNPFEPFESGHPTNMAANITTAAEAFGEIAIAGSVFSIVMSLIQTVTATTSIPTRPHEMKKGQNRKANGTAKILKRLGIPLTNRPFAVCVCYGVVQFFKLPISALPPIPGMGDPESDTVETWWTLVIDAIPAIIDAFLDVQLSHGYYATVMRVMRRDLQQLIGELGSIPSDPASLFILIKEINTYASWRFFCTLAILGEKYLESINATYAIVPNIDKMKNNGQSRQAKSRIGAGQPMLAWRHRAAPSMVLLPNKLADAYQLWGFRQGYAEEQMLKVGDNKTNSPNQPWNQFLNINGSSAGVPGTTKRTRRMALKAKTHRLPQELVTTMEDELDSEYMPFYFHDLRTNELISFMAFIDDVKDSYSVNYAESSGYGRIDPVKIYSSTARSISASFTLVATSPEDFDAMWWSINKLVSMLYPQFSMGKALKAGSGTDMKKFIMPFSQIPTASPVIRLRIGDVIRSNYSRFNLARLFGLSEGVAADPHSAGGTTIPASGVAGTGDDARDFGAAPFDLTYQARAQAAIEDAEATAESASGASSVDIALQLAEEPTSPTDESHGYWPGSEILGRAYLKANSEGYTTYDMDQVDSAPSGGGGTYPSYAASVWNTLFPPPTATSGVNITSSPFASRTTGDGLVNIIARRVSDTNGDFNGSDSGSGAGNTETSANAELRDGQYAEYLVSWVDPNDPADPYGPALSAKQHTHAYVVTSADLYPLPIPAPEPVEVTPADVNINLEQQVLDIYRFFQPKSNAVVRSFESAGGRGLAGVITSFDMDWGEAMWDMTGISRRAPTMCKISIAFSPIHDIVPGLDNNGAMRAYNYPVGKVASGLAEDWTTPGAGPPAGGTARLRPSIGAGASIDDAGGPARLGMTQSKAKAFDSGGEGI